MMTNKPLALSQSQPLSVNAVTKVYSGKDGKSHTAVNQVSFEIRPGEIFGLLGPNGAGKTTTISMITTLETPTSGTVQVFGIDNQKQPIEAKKLFGVVPQEIVTQGFFNVMEILSFHSGYYGILKNNDRIEYLLQKLALWDHRHKLVKQLSGGMKRRLMIAKALVHSPKLLILDEPTAGVDIELRNSLWKFVEELKSEGVSLLLTTHYLAEAEALCDRVGIIHKGQLVKVGITQDIIQEFTQKTVEIEVKENAKHKISSSSFVLAAHESVGDLLTKLKLDSSDILDLRVKEGSLEDAFMKVIGGRP